MKVKDRIIHICFLINSVQSIGFIGLFIGIIPLAIINPQIPDAIFLLFKNKTFGYFHTGVTICSMINWIYCIWFLFKYDRYSKSIFPLFFLNVLYAPIYYYRVRIKKRPLRNKINKPKEEIETEDKSITDDEFIEMNRNNIFGVIDLWASEKSQLDYQKEVPIAQVTAELFCQWEDFYYPDSTDFKQSFDKEELLILSDFDKALKETADKTPENLPSIEEFIKTQEWNEMNKKAIEIGNKLNTVGNNVYNS